MSRAGQGGDRHSGRIAHRDRRGERSIVQGHTLVASHDARGNHPLAMADRVECVCVTRCACRRDACEMSGRLSGAFQTRKLLYPLCKNANVGCRVRKGQ